MALSDKVIAVPNGLQASFALLTSGLPYLWDDGLADWSSITTTQLETSPDVDPGFYINKAGGLVGKPSGFVQQSNPLEPLTTGSGAAFKLRDDGSRYLAKLFAVNNRGTATRLTQDQTSASTYNAWGVEDSDGIFGAIDATSRAAYCGLETVFVDDRDPGLLYVYRGAFGSKRHPHTGSQVTTSNQYTGPRVTSSPTIFKGRFVQLLIAYVSEGGVVYQYDVVWQGLLGKVGAEGTHITLTCDPMSDQIKKVDWPVQLAKGQARGGDSVSLRIGSNPNLWLCDIEVTNIDDPSVKARDSGVPLGQYIGGVFTRIPVVAGNYSVTQIYSWIRDTILFGVRQMLTSGSVPGTSADFEANRFTINSAVEGGQIKLFYTNKSRFKILLVDHGLGHWAMPGSRDGLFPDGISSVGFQFLADTIGRSIRAYNLRAALIAEGDDTIQVTLDNPNNQFDTLSGWDGSDTKGYATITQGDEREIISFDTVTPDVLDARRVVLSGIQRGRAGTKAVAWVSSSDKPDAVYVQQIVMLDAANTTGFKPDEVIITLLGSTGIGAGVSSKDRLGWRYSPGLNENQLDQWGIQGALGRVGDLPEVKTFYIDTPGGGAKALEEYLKFCGIYLITKRYGGGGSVPDKYGISVDVVDAPVQTMYDYGCSDSDRSATEAPKTDYNERLLINLYEYVPKLTFLSDDAFENDGNNPYRKWDRLQAITVYADDSISDYGTGQTLEIKSPTFMFDRAMQLNDVDTARESAFVWATVSAARWFGAFANGNYLLTVKVITPQGWRYQMGGRLRCRFTGITGPDGSPDLDAVGKIMKVDHRFADGCLMDLRLSYSPDSAELCPGATCTGHTSGNAIVLDPTFWSDPSGTGAAGIPFPDNDGSAKDWMWFDPENHVGSDGLQVYIWRANDWANKEQRQITVLDKTTGVVTLNIALGGTLQADITAGTVPVYMSFFRYAQLSPLRKLYAYVADLTYTLNGDAAKEYV